MAKLYKVDDTRPGSSGEGTYSLLALVENIDLDDDQLDEVADLKPGEELEIEPGLTITREAT